MKNKTIKMMLDLFLIIEPGRFTSVHELYQGALKLPKIEPIEDLDEEQIAKLFHKERKIRKIRIINHKENKNIAKESLKLFRYFKMM